MHGGFSAAEHTPAAPSVGFSTSPGEGDDSWGKAAFAAEANYAAILAERKNRDAAEVTSPHKTQNTKSAGRSTVSEQEASSGVVFSADKQRESLLAPRTISFVKNETNKLDKSENQNLVCSSRRPNLSVAKTNALPSTSTHSHALTVQRNVSTTHNAITCTPSTFSDGLIESLGLPKCVESYYREVKKITRLYPWQRECLSLTGVFNHQSNLVYCAPTSGGKSLVSDVLLIKRLVQIPGSIAVMVLPFVTLCRERSDELELMLRLTKIPVRRFFGGGGGRIPPPDGGGGLLVCTPEKFNDLITRIIEHDRVRELCSVVVDELHMVQDLSRGGTLELALTKLLFASAKAIGVERNGGGASPSGSNDTNLEVLDHLLPLTEPSGLSSDLQLATHSAPQIIGMSATLADVVGLARWFDAKLFETDFRPVPLRVHVVSGRDVFQLPANDGESHSTVSITPPTLQSFKQRTLPEQCMGEMDKVAALVREAVEGDSDGNSVLENQNSGGVIVFCSAKFQCESTASAIAIKLVTSQGLVDKSVATDTSVTTAKKTPRSLLVDELLRLQPKALKETDKKLSLATCASRGVVWHHSALSQEEKHIVEKGFRDGYFMVVCCTSTMATGVNLPAKRVVITSPYHFRRKPNLHDLLKSKDLQQMVGRAGRTGFGSDLGDAFVMAPVSSEVQWTMATGTAKNADSLLLEIAKRLTCDAEALSSTIAQQGMRRVMLEAVACGLAQDPGDINRYIQCTLLNALNDFHDVVAKGATSALKWLAEKKFLTWCQETRRWTPSALGRAAAAAHLEPDRTVAVVRDVVIARKCMILETDLHLLYMCVPPDPPAAVDVQAEDRNANAASALPMSGVTPSVTPVTQLASAAPGSSPVPDDECWLNVNVFNRVYRGLSENEEIVARTVGITESYAQRLSQNRKDATSGHRRLRRTCHRFLKALMLHDVVSERDVWETAQAFGVTAGVLSQTQEHAARYAGQIASVCGPMGWGDMEGLVTRLQDRIAAGAHEDILSLTSIPGIGASRARVLYNAGFGTPEAILQMSLKQLATLLESNVGNGHGQMRAAHAVMRGAQQLCEEQRRAAREDSEAKLREIQALPLILELGVETFGYADEEEILELTQRQNKRQKTDEGCLDVVPRALVLELFDPNTATGAVVVRLPDALATLEAFWRNAPAYTFVLRPGTRAVIAGSGPVASPPVAIALAFPSNPHATFYAPIVLRSEKENVDTGDGDVEIDVNDALVGARRGFPWDTVRTILATPGQRKVTVDLKTQLRAMGAANKVTVSDGSQSPDTQNEDESYGIGDVAAPCVDVRVAGWLLRPESKDFDCSVDKGDTEKGWVRLLNGGGTGGAAEALIHAFAGDIDVSAARSRAQWSLDVSKGTEKAKRNNASAAATTLAVSIVAAVHVVVTSRLTSPGFESLQNALETVEMPLVPVLASMETCGVPFACDLLTTQISSANKRLLDIESKAEEIVRLVGAAPATLQSSADVGRFLFEDLKLPPPPGALNDKRKNVSGRKKQKYKLDAEILQQVQRLHAFPKLVMEHRSLSKCVSVAEELVDLQQKRGLVASHSSGVVYLRGSIHQTNSETGRLAMEEPNLQNLPHDKAFAESFQEENAERKVVQTSLTIRSAFRAPTGRVLLSADYKQLELRIAVHLSGDQALIEAFHDETHDPFLLLASRWRKVPLDRVLPADRATAKKLAYASLFGGGVLRFAVEAGCSESEARQLVKECKVPGLEKWRETLVTEAQKRTPPGVVTLGGRTRQLPGLTGGGASAAHDARRAVNTVTQGGGADIVKRAMIDVHAKLNEVDDDSEDDVSVAWRRLRSGGCRLALQVHDELVFELDERDAVVAVHAIRGLMQKAASAFSLSVALPVKVSVGWDYGDLTEARY